jgi:hypothetical protein
LPSGRDLASQPTICRLENLPDIRSLLRMGQALVDQYCASFRHVPKQIVLDVDDTFDAVHGGQQLRLFPCEGGARSPAWPITMSMASSRSWCSMARAAS